MVKDAPREYGGLDPPSWRGSASRVLRIRPFPGYPVSNGWHASMAEDAWATGLTALSHSIPLSNCWLLHRAEGSSGPLRRWKTSRTLDNIDLSVLFSRRYRRQFQSLHRGV